METCFNKLTEFNKHLVRLHVHEIEENLGFPTTSGVEVFAATVLLLLNDSYSVTVAMGTSLSSVVVVLYRWGGELVLPFLKLFVCVCMCFNNCNLNN